MLRFYWSLFRELPTVLRSASETYTFWLTLIVSGVVFLNPELSKLTTSPIFSRWFGVAPVVLLVAYGMLRANFLRCTNLESELATHKGPVQPREWRDLEQLFAEITADLYAFRHLYLKTGKVGWKVYTRDKYDPRSIQRFESVAMKGGALLDRLGSNPLPPDQRTDPVDQWLNALWIAIAGGRKIGDGRNDEDGYYDTGEFDTLVDASKLLCARLATDGRLRPLSESILAPINSFSLPDPRTPSPNCSLR